MNASRAQLIRRPEGSLYRACYAPADLRQMMETAEGRARIRRLPAVHVFFALKEMSEEEVGQLLPHVTQEQWKTVLDLDLWSRDRADTARFLQKQSHALLAEDAVARKLVRAADLEMWLLTFSRQLKVYGRADEEYEGEPRGEFFATPDGNYLVGLPRNPESARLLRALLVRLYQLDAEGTRLTLEECRYRTPSELEEEAYRNRTRRLEELGFQDYFEALGVYTVLAPGSPLPSKTGQISTAYTLLPGTLSKSGGPALLVIEALAQLSRSSDAQPVLEELFFVCNRVLTADRVAPGASRLVKRGLRKTLGGVSLGLECWSDGYLERAVDGLRQHFVLSFFQLGYTKLAALRERAERISSNSRRGEADLLGEATLANLLRRYPCFTYLSQDRVRRRFFERRADLAETEERLRRLEQGSSESKSAEPPQLR